ncbi:MULTISPECIES: class I adenylate-forming enzyme family protein [unclassified Francisella]|uniref:class I adenylate-forming enzyme family protein n=1 Tax=unclassified Francisella TaxID=2610885 RepID=UPI002E34353D|nr:MULTISPECIES: class I adenylate-forming enzyme family protein [unclassified Francisella]MED7818868.1 class I adenylate-forming enzyme family protein [Francisella sp. 19S2-4]MED7829677.1 class I adenylate-forming enzyme family protein [Francisella sp. 19S2-10]
MSQLKKFFENIENHHKSKGLFFGENKFLYQDLLSKSYDLARLLESYSYRKVFSNLKNSPLSITLYIASWIADIDFFVPINPRLVDAELGGILEENSLFITDKLCQLELNELEILYIKDEIEFLKSIPKTQNYKMFEKVITAHISSGTTGFYQKHQHNINQIIKYAQNRVDDLGLNQDDHLLIALSINHAFAFSYQLLPALIMGLDITVIREFNPKLVAKVINESNVTALALLPTMYYFLVQEYINKNNKLHYLSVAGDVASESLNNLVKTKLGIPLLNGIGMTEVFGYGQNLSDKNSNTIKIFKDTKVRIDKFVNSNYGKIFIKNYILPLNNKQEWLETGDIGSFDSQKYELTFYGRYKDIIIKGGSNISPIELEQSILKISEIKSCVVVGKYDKIWGESIWAYLVAEKEYSLEYINNKLAKYLSQYKMLDGIVYIDKIPITPTGKTDRKKLKEQINYEF